MIIPAHHCIQTCTQQEGAAIPLPRNILRSAANLVKEVLISVHHLNTTTQQKTTAIPPQLKTSQNAANLVKEKLILAHHLSICTQQESAATPPLPIKLRKAAILAKEVTFSSQTILTLATPPGVDHLPRQRHDLRNLRVGRSAGADKDCLAT